MVESTKKKTLLLIAPANQLLKAWRADRTHVYQPLGLGIVAALTPDDWKIKIFDEHIRDFRFTEADLVGIGAMTSQVTRAYEIAAIYRKKNIPVVLGGIHATMVPEEASKYVDVVFKGEAETGWKDVIRDFEAGRLKPVYKGRIPPGTDIPHPRRDLFMPYYSFGAIQTVRGCPMNCGYCSVTVFNGRHYRFRPVEDVLDELEEIPQQFVGFIDDNIVGHTPESFERSKKLFEGMIRRNLNKKWISQTSIHFADDPELLQLAKRSGCTQILLGIEAEGADQLKEVGKGFNLRKGKDSINTAFKKIQQAGIGVYSMFIFGFDHDDRKAIRARERFIRTCRADMVQTTILTPFPGTRVYEKIERENRFRFSNFPEAWQYYTFYCMVILHPFFKPVAFEQEVSRSWNRIFHPWRLFFRALRTFFRTWSVTTAMWSYRGNKTNRLMYSESLGILGGDQESHQYRSHDQS